jgi:hypothetical protein
MDEYIEFNPSAFKHKLTAADIRHAGNVFLYEEPMEDEVNKYLLIGANLRFDDTHGNLIEVMYNRIDLDTVNVFHAMPCRKATLALMK